ncbi:hypothetical protein PVT01_080005800 [Plasmodium vivax]|uniref:Fam-m protein n=1 Tax=Plasmodium vivax TaxID=5855 RepID=A0A1G4GW04_PLAVI|nr:hypothetical protein PVT01_080005800 [Plasmodium vivax]
MKNFKKEQIILFRYVKFATFAVVIWLCLCYSTEDFFKNVSSRNNDKGSPFLDRPNRHLGEMLNDEGIVYSSDEQLSKAKRRKNRAQINVKNVINSYEQITDLVHDAELGEDFRNGIKKSYVKYDQRKLFRKCNNTYMIKRLRDLIALVSLGMLITFISIVSLGQWVTSIPFLLGFLCGLPLMEIFNRIISNEKLYR